MEDLHLEAIRTITGLVRGTSHENLHRESGICSLTERRKRHKVLFYHKLINDYAPDYLKSLLPPLVSTQNPYPRRRPLERTVPRCKTETYASSFFPSTTKLWNGLPPHIQASPSISQLKRHLGSTDTVVPEWFYFGNRQQQIIHCRLRQQMSDLNSDLQKRHLLNDPVCACGYPNETAEHFLLHCPRYKDRRLLTIDTLVVYIMAVLAHFMKDRPVRVNQSSFAPVLNDGVLVR